LAPGNILYFCGDFVGDAERIKVDPNGPHGTASDPIIVSGACTDSTGAADPGRIVAPDAAAFGYGLQTMRRDYYTFEHLTFEGYSVLVLDSKGATFLDVEIRNSPYIDTIPGALVDSGLTTTLDDVRIYNAARDGITQQERSHNAHLEPTSADTDLSTWASNRSFLTKQDFQEKQSSITIRNSIVDTTRHDPGYVGYNAVNLYWNDSVLIEDSVFVDAGGPGIRINTDDRYAAYNVSGCDDTRQCPAGYTCNTGGGFCHNAAIDDPAVRDPYVLGTNLEPKVIVRRNQILNHFQTGDNPQCIYAIGKDCSDSRCPYGYYCAVRKKTCMSVKVHCGNHHYGIVVPPGSPVVGTILIEDNSISGFAGNNILVETGYTALDSAPDTPGIIIRGNDISGAGQWGVWVAVVGKSPRPSGSMLIEGNRFHHNGTPAQGWAQGGLQLGGRTANVTVRDNLFYENGVLEGDLVEPVAYTNKFAGLVIAQGNKGTNWEAPSEITIVNNTFVDNFHTNLMTYYLSTAKAVSAGNDFIMGLTIHNNIFVHTGAVSKFIGRSEVQAAWHVSEVPVGQNTFNEFTVLDNNLYWGPQNSTVTIDRSFSIIDQAYADFSSYQSAIVWETSSFELDPQLDTDYLPQNPGAAGYGAQ
jgi:hypothetical protein